MNIQPNSTFPACVMDYYQPLRAKRYSYFIGVLILLAGGMLSVMGYARWHAFKQYHIDIANESVGGVRKQVSYYITEKQHRVKLFAQDHLEAIRALVLEPDNVDLQARLAQTISLHFPDYFAFSLANDDGTPLFEDFDGLISELCLTDIRQFASAHDYHPYIHPNPEGYHFDVMVHYGVNDSEGILFISFLADIVGEVLKSVQTPEHQLLLIYAANQDLIEITADGARNTWNRNDYRLSSKEKARINARRRIENSRWEVVDMSTPYLYSDFTNKIIAEVVLYFGLFTLVAISMLRQLNKEARQRGLAQQQKTDLLGVISHEFRTPTTTIKSALDLIQQGDAGEIGIAVKKYIDVAQNGASQLLMLVDDFLDMQSLESGSLQYCRERIRLKSVVQECVETNRTYAHRFNIQYCLIEPLADAEVLGDSRRLSQVITNLLSNAAKYGCLHDVIEIKVDQLSGDVRVSVTDHGQGIPPEFQARVFEKFAMARPNASNPKVNSSGLGLFLTKTIIEQHGGHIGFQSEPGKGTTFWFTLPVAAPLVDVVQ